MDAAHALGDALERRDVLAAVEDNRD